MYFDYKRALMDLRRKQTVEKSLMQKAGISDSDIKALFCFERRQLYHDTMFYLNLESYIEHDDELIAPEAHFGLETMDEIKNPKLYAALMKLKPDERDLILLHIIDGLSLRQISCLRDKPYEALAKRYKRAVGKLKKYL